MQSNEKELNPFSKLWNLLNTIQSRSLNKRSLKKELQKGMNSLDNTITAFNKIAKNQGAGTFGIDYETIDKKYLAWLTKLNNDYREGKYQPQPARRVFIPKPNGKERPLGIPTIADRVQQQKLYQLLNPFYEIKFSEWSFGFRPGKSCHDAIKRVKQRFKGIKWLIKIKNSTSRNRSPAYVGQSSTHASH
ncbi:MAG: reverse transcriptase domain-containing protein [Candidatus Phytoplasma australasiaticum]|nr:reverse transcriptase domain-containing protein [Candidatus Phytoplasma australasiaticum]